MSFKSYVKRLYNRLSTIEARSEKRKEIAKKTEISNLLLKYAECKKTENYQVDEISSATCKLYSAMKSSGFRFEDGALEKIIYAVSGHSLSNSIDDVTSESSRLLEYSKDKKKHMYVCTDLLWNIRSCSIETPIKELMDSMVSISDYMKENEIRFTDVKNILNGFRSCGAKLKPSETAEYLQKYSEVMKESGLLSREIGMILSDYILSNLENKNAILPLALKTIKNPKC